VFLQAAQALRGLGEDDAPEAYEACLARVLAEPLSTVRANLYADHPDNRPLIEYRTLTALELLQRYNLALVQGLLFGAQKLVITAQAPDLLQVRRVLRWLKFCRLVAQATVTQGAWQIEITGPAAVLAMAKAYGMQFAVFFPVIPILGKFEALAEIRLAHGREVTLRVTEADGLTCPHDSALGHIPPEITAVAEKFTDEAWELDLTPEPMPVGVVGICAPDFTFRHRDNGAIIYVELFHRWHQHALARRIDELQARPNARLVLGIERHLWQDEAMQARLSQVANVLLFRDFPTANKLKAMLTAVSQRENDGSSEPVRI
jgi:predicted nuclease of restriction endonuclease-like RecB superfamily